MPIHLDSLILPPEIHLHSIDWTTLSRNHLRSGTRFPSSHSDSHPDSHVPGTTVAGNSKLTSVFALSIPSKISLYVVFANPLASMPLASFSKRSASLSGPKYHASPNGSWAVCRVSRQVMKTYVSWLAVVDGVLSVSELGKLLPARKPWSTPGGGWLRRWAWSTLLWSDGTGTGLYVAVSQSTVRYVEEWSSVALSSGSSSRELRDKSLYSKYLLLSPLRTQTVVVNNELSQRRLPRNRFVRTASSKRSLAKALRRKELRAILISHRVFIQTQRTCTSTRKAAPIRQAWHTDWCNTLTRTRLFCLIPAQSLQAEDPPCA